MQKIKIYFRSFFDRLRMRNLKKKTKKRLKISLIILGIFIVFLIASVEFTSNSKFCSTCHYMKPFYRSWKTSSHSHIECSKCHYAPGPRSKIRAKIEGLLQLGRYWTKLYLKSKPWAEIPDESCLRKGCHEKRLLEGSVKFKKIVFDHTIHFSDLKRGKQLRCTSCHSQIVQGEHITVTESTCFICHFKKSEHYPRISECSHCHHKEDLISEKTSKYNHSLIFDNGLKCNKCHSHTIMGDGAVPRENCYKCHWETDRLKKYDDTDLMHSTHITSHKIECNQCHLEIQHKIIKDIETLADCKTCHTGSHEAQKILFIGRGGRGTRHEIPNFMLEKGLSCKGCHIFHEEKGGKLIKSETLVARAKACESCHGKGFALIMKDWEISTNKKLSQIKSIYQRAFNEVRRSRSTQKQKAQSLLEDALFNIDVVERGKSVHNIEYSQELLSVSLENIVDALSSVGSSYRPEKFIAHSEKIPTRCLTCHAGIEEIRKEIFGLTFPHKKHLIEQNIECSICHSNARKHGEFIATKQSCAVCHHRKPEKDCTTCHRLQKTIYQGGRLNGIEISPDIMFEAELGCVDCHLDAENKVFTPDEKKCAECHDKDYSQLALEWQSQTANLIDKLKKLLEDKKKLKLSAPQNHKLFEIEKTVEKIELDGSRGTHNYMQIEELLTNFIKKVQSVGKEEEDEKERVH